MIVCEVLGRQIGAIEKIVSLCVDHKSYTVYCKSRRVAFSKHDFKELQMKMWLLNQAVFSERK